MIDYNQRVIEGEIVALRIEDMARDKFLGNTNFLKKVGYESSDYKFKKIKP